MKRALAAASLIMKPEGYADGLLPSIKPLNGSGDFTFSRGSNLSATRINQQGLIEKGRENLLTYSNTFSSWPTLNITSTSGQSGYDGSNNAWLLTDAATSGDHRLYLANSHSGVNTLSVYAKAGTKSIVYVQSYINNSSIAYFDLSSGSVLSTSVDIDSKIESVGNGWYRCSMAFNNTNTYVTIGIAESATRSYVGDGTGTIYIQDAQLEIGLAATNYIESVASTGKAGLLENEPRLDYSGGATSPSLLLEPQRSNIIVQSEYFDGAEWQIFDSIVVEQNHSVSPEGLQNASKITSSGGGNDFLYEVLSVTIGTTYTTSCFIKNIDSLRTNVYGVSQSDFVIHWNGAVISSVDGTNVDYEDYGNGWYRVWQTSPATSTNPVMRFYPDNESVGGGSVLLYGYQVESGSYQTSYIPTYGSSVTRSRDTSSLNLVGAGVNGGWTSGTILIEFEKPYNNENADVIRIHGDSVGGRAYIYNNGYGFASDWGYSSNFTIGENTKIIYRLNTLSTANLFKNGVKLTGAEGSGTAWSDIKYIYLNNQLGAKINIKQIVVFPTALTDSECIKLTTI